MSHRRTATKYRDDGWPLCPSCGRDTLDSQVPIDICITALPADKMFCLRCHWSGFTKPPKPVPSDAQGGGK